MNSLTLKTLTFESPIGPLQLVSNGRALTAIHFPDQHQPASPAPEDAVLTRAATQLEEYFAGQRRQFDLPLAGNGTPFQQCVWQALREIPHGELRSYADIARSIGRHKAVRAVGAANGRNPLPIVVPCHRVIGSNGTLTGYAGGLKIKRQLLALEGVTAFA
ncbi:methylated-DNA--[protein]-cysteine S-methyltransferase [Parahaliea maris]|uniref:methylated-DNA--[protein]-cysteine S-methyltransferase n=1 Tax=Parahaliea maris TaxID=2716870 RepID=UPI0038B2BB26